MHKRIVLLFLISLVVILAMLNFSNPSDSGPFGVLLFFVTLYAFLFSSVFLVVKLCRKFTKGNVNIEKKDYFYSVVISFGPIILLLMRAFNALNIFTVVVAVIFVVLGCFLIKNKFSVVK